MTSPRHISQRNNYREVSRSQCHSERVGSRHGANVCMHGWGVERVASLGSAHGTRGAIAIVAPSTPPITIHNSLPLHTHGSGRSGGREASYSREILFSCMRERSVVLIGMAMAAVVVSWPTCKRKRTARPPQLFLAIPTGEKVAPGAFAGPLAAGGDGCTNAPVREAPAGHGHGPPIPLACAVSPLALESSCLVPRCEFSEVCRAHRALKLAQYKPTCARA